MKRISIFLMTLMLLLGLSVSGHATIININAVSNNSLNPVNIFFAAGTYDLTPIGVADGGTYNSFSTHYSWANSWLWRYTMSSSELGLIDVNHIGYSPTEMAAFETAVTASFTLTTDAYVNFAIYDGPGGYAYSGDNVGGISLYYESDSPPSSVPEPATMLLFGTGLAGMVVLRKRLGRRLS